MLPWFSDVMVKYGEKHILADEFVLADAAFFKVFNFNLIEGDEGALTDPMTAVISESFAQKLFGEEPAMGKMVTGLNGKEFLITGIVEDAPDNSHLTYDLLISWSSTGQSGLNFQFLNSWSPQAVFTYVKLSDPSTQPELETDRPVSMGWRTRLT